MNRSTRPLLALAFTIVACVGRVDTGSDVTAASDKTALGQTSGRGVVCGRRSREFRRQLTRRNRRLTDDIGRQLFELLLAPVFDRLERSERLLIVADGPLHYLPWGALALGGAAERQYLAEWRPLHLTLSATVFGEIKKLRRSGGERPEIELVAFGDPRYPESRSAASRHGDIQVRSTAERLHLDWHPLPETRREIEGIAGEFPAHRVRLFLGEDAREDALKALERRVGILHLAGHGYVNERFPLQSFIALSIPEAYTEGRDNGLLQAWEIFERVRIDADLVVLSACETALGEERGGDGLLGLMRAFQYAGARTVAASLWRVDDGATAELMIRFYRHLRSGESKDQALRAAQMELIHGPIRLPDGSGGFESADRSEPYYWAGFQLYGDWR